MPRKPKKTTQAERERRRKELERRRRDDAVMLVMAETLLNEPSRYPIAPETFAPMMRRLIELLKNEQAKRPAHRPAAEASTGQSVETLVEAASRSRSADEAKKLAIGLVAKMRKLKPATVARRYREHKQQRGGK
jgi:hypothetical protein